MRARGFPILQLLLAAFVFGVIASVLKGNGSGVRDGIGNLSAPWVIVPLLAGAAGSRGRIALGALIGSAATVVALIGFYLANAFVLDLGSHSALHNIGLTLNVGNLWFRAGLVSGPVMGAAGAWAIRRGRFAVGAIAAACLLLEPAAAYLASTNGVFAAGDGQWDGVYAAEAVCGAIAGVALWRAYTRRRESPDPRV